MKRVYYVKSKNVRMNHKRKLPPIHATSSKKRHWTEGLLDSMEDPEFVMKEDDRVIVIKDKYPKAKFHYLVLPKIDIPSLWHVTKEHEELLLHMQSVANDLTKQHEESEFLVGYHAVPSMQRLHLHVISTDFNSPCLKRMHHWNSFTTPLFLHSAEICQQLREKGKLKKLKSKEIEKYETAPLKCHKCSTTATTMPALKTHLLTHIPGQKGIFNSPK